MNSRRQENYHIEIMSVVADRGNSMCVQSCPKCPFARRGKEELDVTVTDGQQDLLLELTHLIPEGALGSVYLYHNILDPSTRALRPEILLAKAPKSVRIGCGRVDAKNVFEGDLIERIRSLIPFHITGSETYDPPSLDMDVCFDPLAPDLVWAQAQVEFATKLAVSLRDALTKAWRSPGLDSLKYRPDVLRLSESWNWLPKNVDRSAFMEPGFKKMLCENRVQAAYAVAQAVFGKTTEEFAAEKRRGDLRSRVTASVDRAGVGQKDYFAVIASFSSPLLGVDFATRIMDLIPRDGFLPDEVMSDETPVNLAVLGDHVWVCHNQAYARDTSLRFTYTEFRAVMARVADGEGALDHLLKAEIRSRRDRMTDGQALESLQLRMSH